MVKWPTAQVEWWDWCSAAVDHSVRSKDKRCASVHDEALRAAVALEAKKFARENCISDSSEWQ